MFWRVLICLAWYISRFFLQLFVFVWIWLTIPLYQSDEINQWRLYDTGSTLPTWRLSFTLRILRCRFAATTSWRTRIRSGGTSTTEPTSDLLQRHSASLSKNTTYISSTRWPRPTTKLIRGESSSKMNKFLFEEKYRRRRYFRTHLYAILGRFWTIFPYFRTPMWKKQ